MKIESLERLIVNGRELSATEVGRIDAEIEKSRMAQRSGRERSVERGLDRQDREEHRKDLIAGRKAGPDSPWKQVMESHQFVWYPPTELDRLLGMQRLIPKSLEGVPDVASLRSRDVPNQHLWSFRPHPEGQWRNDLHRSIDRAFRLAFTESDLLGLFASPADFALWIEEHFLNLRMGRAGLVRAR